MLQEFETRLRLLVSPVYSLFDDEHVGVIAFKLA